MFVLDLVVELELRFYFSRHSYEPCDGEGDRRAIVHGEDFCHGSEYARKAQIEDSARVRAEPFMVGKADPFARLCRKGQPIHLNDDNITVAYDEIACRRARMSEHKVPCTPIFGVSMSFSEQLDEHMSLKMALCELLGVVRTANVHGEILSRKSCVCQPNGRGIHSGKAGMC